MGAENLGPLGTAFVEIRARLDKLDADLRDADTRVGVSMKAIGESAQRAGRTLSLALTVPIVAIAGASFKMAADFEAAMFRVNKLAGVSTANMREMRQAVLDLAPRTGVGPNALAEALYAVTSTGMRGAEALQILEQSAHLSAMGMGEAKDIARVLVAAMTAYGKENLSAATASEVLFKAIREGGTEASQFADTLGRVVGIAAHMGVSFQEVTGFIATFTRLGVNADEATTALRGTLNAMLERTPQAQKELKSLGTNFDELTQSIKTKGLTQAMIDLVKLTGGSDEAIRSIIPNVRALAGVLGIAGSQAKAAVEIMRVLNADTHDAADAWTTYQQTAQFAWQSFTAQLERTSIMLGAQLAPAFKSALTAAEPLLEFVANLITKFGELPQPVQTSVEALVGLAATVGPTLYVLGSMTTAVTTLGEAFVKLGGIQVAGNVVSLVRMLLGSALVGAGFSAAAIGVGIGVAIAQEQKLEEQLKRSGTATDDQRKAIGGLSGALNAMGQATMSGAEAQAKLAARIAEVKQQRDDLLAHGGGLGSATDAQKKQLADLNAELDRYNGGWVATIKPIESAGSGVDVLRDKTKRLEQAVKDAAEQIAHLSPEKKQIFINAVHANAKEEDLTAAFPELNSLAISTYKKQIEEATVAAKSHQKAVVEMTSSIDDLSRAQVEEIGHLHEIGKSDKAIADTMGITVEQVHDTVVALKDENDLLEYMAKSTFKRAQEAAKQFRQEQEELAHVAGDEITKWFLAYKEAQEQNTQAALTGTALRLHLIDVEEAAQIAALQHQEQIDSEMRNRAIAEKQTYFQHLRDLEHHAPGTFQARMAAGGVKTQYQLEVDAAQAEDDFRDIKAAGIYSAEAIRQAWERWQKALTDKRGVESWTLSMRAAIGKLPGVLANAAVQTGTTFQKLGNMAAGALSVLGGGAIGHVFAGLAKNATGMMGALLPGIGEALGGLIGPMMQLLAVAFDHRRKDFKRMGRQLGVELSDGLLDQLKADAHKYGGEVQALLLNLDKVISEAGGLKSFGTGKAMAALHDLFSMVETGKLTAAQVGGVFDRVFGDLIPVAIDKTTGLASRKFLDLIDLARRFGVEAESVTKFLQDQAASVAGGLNEIAAGLLGPANNASKTWEDSVTGVIELQDKIDKLYASIADMEKKGGPANAKQAAQLGVWRRELDDDKKALAALGAMQAKAAKDLAEFAVNGQEKFDRLGRLAVVAFGAAIGSGQTLAQAIESIGPALDQAAKAQSAFGLTASGTFADLLQIKTFVDQNKELVGTLDGVNKMMSGLQNSGLLTQATFTDLTTIATDTFTKMVGGGLSSQNAMALMQPTLQTIWQLEHDFGFQVDDATQKLIDQGVEAGIVGEKHKSAQDRIADGIEHLDTVLTAMATFFGVTLPQKAKEGADKVQDELDKITPPDLTVHVNADTSGIDDWRDKNNRTTDVWTGGIIRAGGGVVQHFDIGGVAMPRRGTDTIAAMLTPGELVLNAAQQATLAMRLTNGGRTINFYGPVFAEKEYVRTVLAPMVWAATGEGGDSYRAARTLHKQIARER